MGLFKAEKKHKRAIVVLSLVMGENVPRPDPRSRKMLCWIVLKSFDRN